MAGGVQLWDIKEWKAIENPHNRLFAEGDDMTVDRVNLLDSIVVLATGCAPDDGGCIIEVAKLIKTLDQVVYNNELHHAAAYAPPMHHQLRCRVCPDGGDVVDMYYKEVCRRCGEVCGDTSVLAVNAFRVFADDAVNKAHHGTAMDQRAFNSITEPAASKKRKSILRTIILQVCNCLQLLDSIAAEALVDCEIYLAAHPRVQLHAKDMRLAKRLAAAAVARTMLKVYAKDYFMDPVLKVPRRRFYNNLDTVLPIIPTTEKSAGARGL